MLSGPWKLSRRFRCVSVTQVSVTFPSRFRCVSLNVSTTFPSRFRRVSIAFPFAFPLRVRWARACPPTARPALRCCGARAAEQIRKQNCFGTVAPTSSRNLRSRVRSRGSTFPGVLSSMLLAAPSLGGRCDAGPRVALTGMCFKVFAAASENPRSHWGHVGSGVFQRFHYVSVNVSVTFPSTFPSRFRQRFSYVSIGQVRA